VITQSRRLEVLQRNEPCVLALNERAANGSGVRADVSTPKWVTLSRDLVPLKQ